MLSHRTRVALLATALALALAAAFAAGPASAGIWTDVPSGTSSTITAIEYQSDTRFWFTTAGGEIWRRRADLSGFQRVHAGGAALNDIEFQPGGQIGFAVGIGGTVLRSIDSGATWSTIPAAGIPVSNVGDGSGNKCTTTEPLGSVNFVHFAGPGRVWIGGPRRQIASSQPSDPANVGAIGWWYDANRKSPPVAGDNCFIEQADGFADMFVTASPSIFYIAAAATDQAILSTDNLRSQTTTLDGEVANGLTAAGAMAGDPGSPNRMWGVSPAPYGNSTMQYTENGWDTSSWVRLLDETAPPWPSVGPYDVAFNGGTVLAAGNGNFVIHSTNGRDFWWNGADGASTDWRAVALASATQGAIGGVGGRLMLTTQASTLPIPVTPSPPVVPPVVRPPTTRTPAGSDTPPNVFGRPETHTTGGATLAIWKRIALSQGRFVPVRVSARSPRRFVVEIRRAARPRRRVAMAKARLGSGTKLVKVPLRRSVRTGRYRVVVRVYQGRRQIGRRITVAFVLAR
ncbi:MAG TPA: hypothetical protein VGO48_02920 [Conexibacter sp.]|jgi:photosystem II stability/assembly factor-like uncharacterized protein|nr:hypothetical protein [Conexibacter sp.]